MKHANVDLKYKDLMSVFFLETFTLKHEVTAVLQGIDPHRWSAGKVCFFNVNTMYTELIYLREQTLNSASVHHRAL